MLNIIKKQAFIVLPDTASVLILCRFATILTSQAIQWVKYHMDKKRFISSFLTASFCLIVLSPLHAGVYKWVDENGQVHYGEQPGNTGAEKVTIRNNETTKPRSVNKVEEDAKSDKKNKDPQAEAPLVEVEPSKKEKRKLCNEAKSDLAAINSRGRVREINEKGEYTYLSEPQRQQRISAAKKKQREFCR